jgi:hypothetical protein
MKRRTLVAFAATGGALLLTDTAATASTDHNPCPYEAQSGKATVLAAAGDISREPDGGDAQGVAASYLCNDTRKNAQALTANQVEDMKSDLVALLGDEQY